MWYSSLLETYGERGKSTAIGLTNACVEVFASADTGSWTNPCDHGGSLTCLCGIAKSLEEWAEGACRQSKDA